MTTTRICDECGAELPVNAPEGLCPRCLVGMGVQLASEKAADSPLNPDHQAGERIGRYQILQKIGEGGCGLVYMAEQEEPVRRKVALKVIKLGMDTKKVIARFEAERQALALMDHANIAKIFDAGATEAGRPYFVMELVKGIPITRYCDAHKLGMVTRLGLFIQVCQAIQHAHQKGIIHRDIKPSNILVADHDGAPVPKIIDFGIAKATQGRLMGETFSTALEQFIGTPAYMSPEQAEMSGLDIDTRTDIYSLGVLLYELLTGKLPFEAKELLEAGLDAMRRTIRHQEPVRPSTRLGTMIEVELANVARCRRTEAPRLVHVVRGDLDWIVMKCLEKDRARRYETANGLASDIRRHLNNEPVVACPPSKRDRLQKLVRRNKLAFVAGAAFAAVLVAGVVVSSWQAVRASRAEKVATDKTATAEEQRLRAERQSQALRLLSYVHAMNLALRYCQESNFGEAWSLLQGYQANQADRDLRGFEWRYLYRLCRGNYSMALPKHEQVLGSMEFSRNAQMLATYCWDQKLRVWDVEAKSRKPVFEMAGVTGLGGFSENGDHLVFGLTNGTIQDYEIGTHRRCLLLDGVGELVAFSARGRLVVTLAADSELKVWDLSSRQLRFSRRVVRRHLAYGWIDRTAIDTEGKVLAVVEAGKGPEGLEKDLGIRLWSLANGDELGFLEDNRQIHALRLSSNGRLLAVGDDQGTVKLWDLFTHQLKLIKAHQSPVSALAFSRGGQSLATGSSDETIKLWDVQTCLEKPVHLRGQVGAVWSLAFTADGQRLASGSRASSPRIWRLYPHDTKDEIRQLFVERFANFAFSPDGKTFAAGCRDNTVKVWDVETLEVKHILAGMQYVVALSSDSQHLLAATRENNGYWWDLVEETNQPLPGYSGDVKEVICVDTSPDGRIAALGLENGYIDLVELRTGKTQGRLGPPAGPVRTLKFSSDGRILVSGGSDHEIRLWDVERQVRLREDEDHHKGEVCAAVISRDGKHVASGCGAGTIKLWDSANLTKALVTIAAQKSALRTLDFSKKGTTLASGSEDNTVKLWNVESLLGPALPREIGSFTMSDKVRLVRFSPDDRLLAIVTDDGVLSLLRAVDLEEADRDLEAQMPSR